MSDEKDKEPGQQADQEKKEPVESGGQPEQGAAAAPDRPAEERSDPAAAQKGDAAAVRQASADEAAEGAAQENIAPTADESASPAGSAGEGKPPAPAAADPEREAKLKAAAEARAARAAAKAAAAGAAGEPPASAPAAGTDPEREAKLKAAAEAREARAAAKAKAESEAAPEEPKAPSHRQPQLDEAVGLVRALVAEDAVDEALINEMNDHMPTIVVKGDRLLDVARVFKTHPTLDCSYLRNVSGIDYETHLEVVYHLVSLATRHEYALKVKTDREAPQIPSVVSLWATANWNEREIFDLLGIGFTGHPDLRRIMMPDDWVGHPLRKDYEPLDPEV